MRIASFRMHEVRLPLLSLPSRTSPDTSLALSPPAFPLLLSPQVWPAAELDRDEKTDTMVLWSHSDPTAVARACLLGVTHENDDWKTGHEVFYIVSPKNVAWKTRGAKKTNEELAKACYPQVRPFPPPSLSLEISRL